MQADPNLPIEENLPVQPVVHSTANKLPVWQFGGLLLLVFLVGLGTGYLLWAYPLQGKVTALEQSVQQAQSTAAASSQAAAAAATQQAEQAAANNQPQKVTRYDVPIDDDPVLGSDTAAITLIEFSDYECPYCQKWHKEVFNQLKDKYGDQIRFVYRDFPLYSIHPNAASAAEAAQCAYEQKHFWEYHDLLFSGQKSFSAATFQAYADQLSLDQSAFSECLSSRRYQSEVEADFTFASNLGIESTPTFFINGIALVGAQPYSVFEQVIDMELAGKIPE